MVKTIIVGSCVSVQGTVETTFSDGRIAVRVGSQVFTGVPASHAS